jgi:lysine/ornithine N-monooxygenase
MNATPTHQTDTARALAIVEEAIIEIGYERINPESLQALGDVLHDEDTGWAFRPEVHRAYRVTMAGFRALLAPAT